MSNPEATLIAAGIPAMVAAVTFAVAVWLQAQERQAARLDAAVDRVVTNLELLMADAPRRFRRTGPLSIDLWASVLALSSVLHRKDMDLFELLAFMNNRIAKDIPRSTRNVTIGEMFGLIRSFRTMNRRQRRRHFDNAIRYYGITRALGPARTARG